MLFPQLTVAYDIIEHLSAVDKLKKEVEMALGDDEVSHRANIRMPEERYDRCFPYGTNLSVLIFRSGARIRSSGLTRTRLGG